MGSKYAPVVLSTIIGGQENKVYNCVCNSAVIGGCKNQVQGSLHSGILSGAKNTINSSCYSNTIGGQSNSTQGSKRSSIVAGSKNGLSYSYNSTVIGGSKNQIYTSFDSVILGGNSLVLSNVCSLVYVPELMIHTASLCNSSNMLLVRDTDGMVRYREVDNLLGSVDRFSLNILNFGC